MTLVEYQVENGVAVLTLNRPERLNAVIPPLVDELCAALDRVVPDSAAVAILRGAGRAFCAGHDLKADDLNRAADGEQQRLERLQEVTRKVRCAPVPVIAAVRGYALGAGCEFALCSDLVIAAKSAVFGFPEVSVGRGITGGISHILPLAVGLAKAKELVLLGEQFNAQTALRLGLVNEVVEDSELDNRVSAVAQRLAGLPRLALASAKTALDRGAGSTIEHAYATEVAAALALHGTEDAKRATEAFRRRSIRGTTRADR